MSKQLVSLLFLFCVISCAYAKKGVIQCANLIYGGTHTSRCFSDAFLSKVQEKTTIPTERRFKTVKLMSDELFKYPFAMMTGEKNFYFTAKERKNFKLYLEKGGFILSSAGCSNKDFDKAFRREIKRIFPKIKMKKIPMTHPMFKTVNKIDKLKTSHGVAKKTLLEGLTLNGKLVMVYSRHGLNDTANTKNCCCCGGNEISNSINVNVNILVYALLH